MCWKEYLRIGDVGLWFGFGWCELFLFGYWLCSERIMKLYDLLV